MYLIIVIVVMETLYNAYCKYFNILKSTGYLQYNELYYLLIVSFIQEGLSCGAFNSNENQIDKILNCIYNNSCLFESPNNTSNIFYNCK